MRKLLLLPEALLPYAFGIGFLVSEFFPTEDTSSIVFAFILGALFLSCPICNVIYMIKSRKSDPRELLREALTVKLIHIPAFVGVFIMGVIAAIMIFMTLPLILLLVLWDYLILLSSGMLSVFALIKTQSGIRRFPLSRSYANFSSARTLSACSFYVSSPKSNR